MSKRAERQLEPRAVHRAGSGALGLALLALAACGPNTAVSPPEANPFMEAGAAFDQRDYAAAANAYRRALTGVDSGIDSNREEALFRLSLMYALPESVIHDPDQARLFLDEMTAEYPESTRAIEVRWLLDLQSTIDSLRATVASQRSELGVIDADRVRQTEVARDLQTRIEELRRQLEATQTELERLRQIDLGRRPRE